MDDFDGQRWLQVDVSEEKFPIENEFMCIRNLGTLGQHSPVSQSSAVLVEALFGK